jgi:hypothetical protein
MHILIERTYSNFIDIIKTKKKKRGEKREREERR